MDKLPTWEKQPLTSRQFLSQSGLYAPASYAGRDNRYVHGLLFSQISLDSFCVECKAPSVFVSPGQSTGSIPSHPTPGYYRRSFQCSRISTHSLDFFIKLEFEGPTNVRIIKVGQYPSVADLGVQNIQKYRKLLGEDRYRELSSGYGLFAHGVGIGSFVYLRRIFENLIVEASISAASSPEWNAEEFGGLRMEEKIIRLKKHLPEFLVQNRSIYGVLSSGVHELSEEECLTHFPAVSVGIELILDQKLADSERIRKQAEATQKISAIKQQLNKRAST